MTAPRERVLVIPTEVFRFAGVFQGFCDRVDHYLPLLLRPENLSYRPRAEVEDDPTVKQLIPYVVLRWHDQLFHYARGKRGSEARLHALRSIGVGGHIQAEDEGLFDTAYREAMFRELAEEVDLDTTYEERCLGLINDDATPVGQVHLGIVHVFDLVEPRVRARERALAAGGFAPCDRLWQERAEFETWSQFVLGKLAGKQG